ncbi:hypothetical protein ACFVFS_36050 [Kitasatospora sp. NPDC057692]|uniref:hypothetical protein n=1 Tax=Kitasatospora sp. NPDC057692 TaxID=3346215 RepID=UPI00369C4A16
MAAHPREPARGKAYAPKLHEPVRDMDSGKVGAYMGTEGGLVHLRRPEGGCEWTVKPTRIEPITEPTSTAA